MEQMHWISCSGSGIIGGATTTRNVGGEVIWGKLHNVEVQNDQYNVSTWTLGHYT